MDWRHTLDHSYLRYDSPSLAYTFSSLHLYIFSVRFAFLLTPFLIAQWRCSTVNDSANDCAEKANGAINKMAEVIIFRLNIISLYGAKKELMHRIQTVLNATIIKVLYWLFF